MDKNEAERAGMTANKPEPTQTQPGLGKQAQSSGLNPNPGLATGQFPSTSDRRVENNVMRHNFRLLSDQEKQSMQEIKDMGLAMHERVAQLGNSREVSVAKTKIEEAVMWAVKHITA